MRIGHGYDVHAFCEGTEITLCGVSIPHDHGFYAHSDGDVALHALCDALLGAAALGDIGRHFPDTDPKFKNIDSRVLLQQVVSLLASKHMQCNNADVTIVAQSPRLAPYIPSMADVLARELDIAADRVNVKATTTEQLGFTGRREGISAYAVVTVNESGGQ